MRYIRIIIYLMLSIRISAQDSTSESNNRQSVPFPQVSNLNIKAFCQDSLGYMWIATPRGLNRYNGYEFLHFFHDKNDPQSIDNDFIVSLFLDSRHRLWIGTGTGVDRYDFAGNYFHHYSIADPVYVHSFFEDHAGVIRIASGAYAGWIDEENQKIVLDAGHFSNNVSVLWEDSSNRLWAGTAGLASRKDSTQWEITSLPDNRLITCMMADLQGIYWMGTNAGIILFDPVQKSIKPTPEALRSNKKINTSYIHFIKEVSPLKLLIGTSSHGIFLYDIMDQTLTHNPAQYTENLTSKQLISCYVDFQENIWIGSFDKGFSVINPNQKFFNVDTQFSNTFKNMFVTRIVEDKYKNFWVSTRYDGLFHCSPAGKITVYNTENSNLFGNSDILIETLFIDSKERLWIGLKDQLIVTDFSSEGKINIHERIPISSIGSGSMAEDSHGNIWIGIASGLYVVRSNRPVNEIERLLAANVPDVCVLPSGELLFSRFGDGVYRFNPETGASEIISMPTAEASAVSKSCVNIFKDSKDRVWFGSYSEGVLLYTADECRVFSRKDGLPSNDITCIREDENGDIWMSTSYGLARMKPDFGITNYFSYDGTLGDQYHEKAAMTGSDGRIFFAGNHGLTFFTPLTMLPDKKPPMIRLEDLKILNQSIQPATGKGSVLKKSIAYTDKITLNHKHSIFSIDYSGIDFPTPQKITYAYKLEGFDTDWNYVGSHRRATYSNLASGNYTFIVKAFNSDGLESEHPAILQITVKPAPWFTWYAWLFYFGVVMTIIILLFRSAIKIKLQKQNLEIEHNEREREREIAEMKLVFFTNISHELRTPLTLISAPLQQLLARHPEESTDRKLLTTLSRNVQRLLRLMNQLLDFRKMESGMLALKVQLTDIVSLISGTLENYAFPASEKLLNISVDAHVPFLNIWVDADKLEKILHNLLSNALKHTPAKGSIKISTEVLPNLQVQQKYDTLFQEDIYLEISVQNTGAGIPPDKLDEVFERYQQVDSGRGVRNDYAGTGIGLHYTRRLVETHKGGIKAYIPDEGGIVFSFVLPLGDVYSENEKEERKDVKEYLAANPVAGSQLQPANKKHKYTILIAEDNIELMAFLRDILSGSYNLIEAADGNEAWNIVQKKSPDLILSDVLMPVMSGYELCANVKKNPLFSHIPVILLTAKSTIDDQLEGLEQGADAYICKPFNVEFLLLTIKNQLTNRDILRQYYATPQDFEKMENPVKLNKMDRKFMDKLLELFEKELGNSELNIDDIVKEMAFSRTSFYRKLKGLTDMSPADFLRNYRLRRAAEIISEGSASMSEVAENTGFGNYAYFSVAFKKHFGISPKDYKAGTK